MTDGLLSQLDERPSIGGPAWLVRLKDDAAARLRAHGLPTKKHEAWRFTPVRDVVDTRFGRAQSESTAEMITEAALALRERGHEPRAGESTTILVVDGQPTIPRHAPDGVHVDGIDATLVSSPDLLERTLGRVARADHFAGMNAAMFEGGLVVRIERGARPSLPIEIVHVSRHRATPLTSYPRLLVIAEEGSEATIIESYVSAGQGARYLTNAVTEVFLLDGSHLDHTRYADAGDGAIHMGHLAVSQGAGSRYTSHVVTLGGALSRVELDVHLAGDGARAELDGIYLVDREEHVDHQLFVEHAIGGGTSHTRYRGLLDGRGHAVFNAMGIVRPQAQRSSAHQENKNLLLSDDATIDTKPHLEIEADDVKASHGATIGSVDDEALFYLRSRGIDEDEARDVLTYAFLRALLDGIPHEPTRERLAGAVLARLRSGERIREVTS